MLSLIKQRSYLGGLALLIVLCMPTHSHAAGPVTLTDEQGEYPLGLHLDILEDQAQAWTIDDVTTPAIEPRFQPSQVDIPNFGFTSSAYWVRFRVRNEAEHTSQWQLELAYSEMESIELYLPQPGRAGFDLKKTGSLLPFESRDIPHQNFIFNLPLPAHVEQTIYLRLASAATLRVPLRLWSPEALTQEIYAEQFKNGLFYGVLLIMLGYNLFIFMSLHDTSYLYYSLFLVSFVLAALAIQGLLQSYLHYNPIWWSRYAVVFLSPLCFITALRFTGTFLSIKTRTLRLYKIMLALQVGLLVPIVLSLFVPRRFIAGTELVFMLASLLLILIVGLQTWQQGYRPARYFLLAWLGLIIPSSLVFLARLGLQPINAVTEEGMQIGVVLLVMLLSLTLANRINLLKTETERANRQLRESEQRLRGLIEGSIQGILVHRSAKPLLVNPAYAHMLGYDSPNEIMGMDSVTPLLAPDEQERLARYHARAASAAAPSLYEYDAIRKDGSRVILQQTATTIPWGGEPAVLATTVDITQRKHDEAMIQQLLGQISSGRAQLQALSRRLLDVQEAERRHIARELHDEIGQALTGLNLILEVGSQVSDPALRARLDQAQALVTELTTRVRQLSLDLRPAMLDDLGLLPTLLWHIKRYTAQTQVEVNFLHMGLDRRFAPDMEIAAYRTIQEALTNVARHAGVRAATVRVWANEYVLGMQVEDQGAGFEPPAVLARHDSSGLVGIRERLLLLGGDLRIESAPGAGTSVTAELPLAASLERRRSER